MAIKIYQESEKKDTNVYLKLTKEGKNITVDSVTSNGQWVKTLCEFSSKGIRIFESAEDAGFATDKQGRIKVIKS